MLNYSLPETRPTRRIVEISHPVEISSPRSLVSFLTCNLEHQEIEVNVTGPPEIAIFSRSAFLNGDFADGDGTDILIAVWDFWSTCDRGFEVFFFLRERGLVRLLLSSWGLVVEWFTAAVPMGGAWILRVSGFSTRGLKLNCRIIKKITSCKLKAWLIMLC